LIGKIMASFLKRNPALAPRRTVTPAPRRRAPVVAQRRAAA
jgi:hypothetical protein